MFDAKRGAAWARVAVVAGLAAGLGVGLGACGGEKPGAGREEGSTAGASGEGELFFDKSEDLSAEKHAGDAIARTLEAYEKMPATVGVKVVDRSDRRLVMDLDWGALKAAARGRPARESVPARIVYDATPEAGKTVLRMRAYYTGNDEKVAQMLREQVGGAPRGKVGAAK